MSTITLADAVLTRVGYVDATVPPEVGGLTARDIAQVPWRAPLWADGDQLRVGVAAWFADVAGRRVAFDPVQAADAVLRSDHAAEAHHQVAIAAAFAAAGFARESVDLLVMTHIEGVGMIAWRDDAGAWAPFFPNARILVSDVTLREFVGGPVGAADDIERQAWQAMIEQGRVGTYADGEMIVPGLVTERTGAHCAGHSVLHFVDTSGARQVTMLGHLAVSPLHFATGECAALHVDAAAAWSRLHDLGADGRTLIGPLWPAPGFGRWLNGAFHAGAMTAM